MRDFSAANDLVRGSKVANQSWLKLYKMSHKTNLMIGERLNITSVHYMLGRGANDVFNWDGFWSLADKSNQIQMQYERIILYSFNHTVACKCNYKLPNSGSPLVWYGFTAWTLGLVSCLWGSRDPPTIPWSRAPLNPAY